MLGSTLGQVISIRSGEGVASLINLMDLVWHMIMSVIFPTRFPKLNGVRWIQQGLPG